jgi:hypothetical protein
VNSVVSGALRRLYEGYGSLCDDRGVYDNPGLNGVFNNDLRAI